MKVLVTGGAGYIGSHAVRELREAGHAVAVLDDLSYGHREAVPRDVPFIDADLADAAALRRGLEGADAVIHFAGLLSVAESVRPPLWPTPRTSYRTTRLPAAANAPARSAKTGTPKAL